MTPTYPLAAVRALALHTQGLAEPMPRRKPSIDDVYSTVESVGWVQIDTLQVVRRAQYLTLWSRLGTYDPDHLDSLLFDGGSTSPDNNRRLFEYWTHAACIIPLTQYRHVIPLMRRRGSGRGGWHRKWAADPENRKFVRSVLERVQAEGAARPADFRTEKKAPGSWWNWDYSKIALEYLYDIGELAISNRVNFQRIYDVRDRVLPDWVDRTEPTEQRGAGPPAGDLDEGIWRLCTGAGGRLLPHEAHRVEAHHRVAHRGRRLRPNQGHTGRSRRTRPARPPRQPAAARPGRGQRSEASGAPRSSTRSTASSGQKDGT